MSAERKYYVIEFCSPGTSEFNGPEPESARKRLYMADRGNTKLCADVTKVSGLESAREFADAADAQRIINGMREKNYGLRWLEITERVA